MTSRGFQYKIKVSDEAIYAFIFHKKRRNVMRKLIPSVVILLCLCASVVALIAGSF